MTDQEYADAIDQVCRHLNRLIRAAVTEGLEVSVSEGNTGKIGDTEVARVDVWVTRHFEPTKEAAP
jgi:hypothetical protein